MPAHETDPESQAPFRLNRHHRTMRILVVDDDRAVREAVGRALRQEGYEVDAAGNGDQALQQMAERAPDAVVLDVLMPRLDGLEVCPPAPRGRRPDADPDAHRARRRGGPGRGPRRRRGRLPGQAVRARGAAGPGARAAPPAGAAGEGEVLRFADLTLDPVSARSPAASGGLELTRTEFQAARAVPAAPSPGAHARRHLRAGVGLRLRAVVELARGLRRDTCAARPRPRANRG